MLNMSQINDIRDLSRKGYSISKISSLTGFDRKTVRKYLGKDDFSPEPPIAKTRTSIVTPYIDIITEWLEEDQKHWSKQRHTAKRIHERLVDEYGFSGSYDSVQKFVQKIRTNIQTRGTQELVWEPGSAQVDFGEADFNEDTDCVRRKYLTVSFPYSNDSFSQVFRGETAECVCQGLLDIFDYIGGVPVLLIFDNATGVGRRVMDKVHEADLFSRFRAHYGFRIRFCNPYAGYEKGNVENKVGTTRRNLFVPVPTYHDIEEYNRKLLGLHEKKASEVHYKKGTLISELFEEDRKHFLPLPVKPFNVCRYEKFTADGYGKICLDGRHYYSTKPENHNRRVLVGIRAHYIDILEPDGNLLVRHMRQYGNTRTDLCDYSTSLEMLSKNIGAWDNSGFRKDAPELIRDYIDGQPRAKRKSCVRLLSELSKKHGYLAAVGAFEMAVKRNSVNKSDLTILADRITGYGIDTPPEPGPPLAIYDQMFLPSRNDRKGVSVL